jgi:hypothetical protein
MERSEVFTNNYFRGDLTPNDGIAKISTADVNR